MRSIRSYNGDTSSHKGTQNTVKSSFTLILFHDTLFLLKSEY